MAGKSNAVVEPEREFIITRVFDAPRSLVFQAWTDPRHLAQWWGPHAFTNTVPQMDARPGGAYRIVMHSPDGAEYPMKGIYREIIENERIVYTSDLSEHPDDWHDMIDPERNKSAPKPALEIINTVTFREQNGKTTMTIRMQFETATRRDRFVKVGMCEGWSQSFERLDKLLGKAAEENFQDRPAMLFGDREIVATRFLDAPRGLAFDAWSEPRQIEQWWGPNGFTTETYSMDFRPGGVWRYVMHGPDGRDYQNKIVYVEVVRPERLVYKHVGDKDCEPADFQVTVTFDEQGGKTRLTMRMVFPTPAARDHIVNTYGAVPGLDQTLARLVQYLGKKG